MSQGDFKQKKKKRCSVTEAITVAGESPAIELSRSSAAAYVGEQEVEACRSPAEISEKGSRRTAVGR